MAATSGVQQQLQIVGLKIARDSQVALLSAVADSLQNIKQITAAGAQGGASGPVGPGVGGAVDVKA